MKYYTIDSISNHSNMMYFGILIENKNNHINKFHLILILVNFIQMIIPSRHIFRFTLVEIRNYTNNYINHI